MSHEHLRSIFNVETARLRLLSAYKIIYPSEIAFVV